MRLSLAATFVALSLSGCMSQGVPVWAMHVRSHPVEPGARVEEVAALLRAEMARPGLALDHLAPEQIALVAVQEMELDHQVDAALWLSMASYRYHQEALVAIIDGYAGERNLPPNVRRSAYVKLVETEVERFVNMGFQHEVAVLGGRAYGRGETERALQEQLTTLGKTTALERESLREALWQLQPASAVAATASRYPGLAEAFRQRLVADANRVKSDENPALYLARTPIAAVQAAALDVTVGYFDPWVCAALASGFPALRPAVLAQLSASRAQTRANAAATLGLAPSAESRAALEARLAVETNRGVKLAIAASLVHHEVPDQAVAVTSALQTCEKNQCTLPVMLAFWLPESSRNEADPAAVARIARGNEFEPRAHLFAAALLRELGRAKPLEEPAIEALIVAARRREEPDDKRATEPAYEAIAESNVLSRAAVLERIGAHPGVSPGPDQLHPGPLLARLARVAEPEDLPLLGRLMARFAEAPGPEAGVIIEAAFHISGEPARVRLLGWLDRYPDVRVPILVGLLEKTSGPAADLEAIVARADARTILLWKGLRKSPDLTPSLAGYLRNGTPEDKWAAAQLAGAFRAEAVQPELRQLLRFRDSRYYPNDAVIRHAAMMSLVQVALARTAKPAPTGAPSASN
ncbi:MAG: hypothetical protein ABUR63_11125 [Verrucomicrobiota bacterium]